MKMIRPKLNWFDRLYLPQIISGLWRTLKHLPRRKVTVQYPEVKPLLHGATYRGMPTLVSDSDGRGKCVACQLCEFVCPPKAIRIVPGERDAVRPDGSVEKEPAVFDLDMLRCIYCGLCEEACPEEAIFLRNDFAAVGYARSQLKLEKHQLLKLGGVHDDKIWKWKNK